MAKHSVCHIEWSVTNLKRAQAFYGGLFGWQFEPMGEEYLLFNMSNLSGGLMQVEKAQPAESPNTIRRTL